MMPCNALQPSGPGGVERASAVGGNAPAPGGFISELAAQIEKETGAKVDPQALADWLKEHSDDYPAIAPDGLLPLLAQLLVDSSVVGGAATQAPGGGAVKDPTALLERLIAASGGSVQAAGKAGGPAVGKLLAALYAGRDGRPLPEQANADPSAPAAFQQLLQSTAAAATGGPALPIPGNGAGSPPLQVTTPVAQAGFGEAVGDRLFWMVRHEVQHARLQLNPPGLGPLDITVSLHDDQISIALNAHHALTREVLAADAPRLRGLLADAGFGAVDVNVSSQDPGRGDQPPSGAAPRGFIPADASVAVEPAGHVQGEGPLRRGRSLVDHYA